MTRPDVQPLPPEVESLLASERVIVPESDEFRARVLARARATVQRGGASTRPMPRASWLRGMRLLAAAALGLLTVALGALALQARNRAAIPPPSLSPTTTQPMAPTPAANEVLPRAENAGDLATQTSAPEERQASSSAGAATAPRPATPGEAYTNELRVLQRAREAVARGDFTSALAAVGEHGRRFPAGQLAEEREALRVKALVGLGRLDDARRAAAAFRERFPRSVLMPRMEETLQKAP